MNYTSTLLTTVADCDILLTMGGKEKETLEFRKTSLTRQLESSAGSAIELQVELKNVNDQIVYYTGAIPGMMNEADKSRAITTLARYEYRKVVLTQRGLNHGAIAQIDSEHDISKIEKQLEENAAFIAVITARKNEL